MGIGRSFEEAFQKALRMTSDGAVGFHPSAFPRVPEAEVSLRTASALQLLKATFCLSYTHAKKETMGATEWMGFSFKLFLSSYFSSVSSFILADFIGSGGD